MSSCLSAGYRPAAFSCYLRDISQHTLLSHQQERDLVEAISQGDPTARERMVAGNLRLVIHIAKNYRRSNIAIDDLVSEGNIGLLRAIAKFNPNLGFRFSTYATHWIHESIRRSIMNQGRLVRLPVHVAKRLNAYVAAQRRLMQSSRSMPRYDDIARATGDSTHCVRELMIWEEPTNSLQVGHESGEGSWQDSLADENAQNPADSAERQDLLCNLQRLIAQLKPREQHILCARFGMGKRSSETTLDTIAGELGITRERIRQIQINILQQLKAWLIEAGYDASCVDSLDRD
ncbi:MAG: sigma-70 family RNA polymerase sigma factor [Pseudomonadota bacterium]